MSEVSLPILIITGMHRSGTSLTASLLQSAGVNIGNRLIAPSEGNIKGHFEDVAVVQFHEQVLQAYHLSPQGWITLEEITEIPKKLMNQAQAIISSKRETKGITGWKDPRGTLFLKFWESELPEAKFIFLYRSPWEVVDSLFRRGDEIFVHFPELALTFWMIYNRAILRFYETYGAKSVLLNIKDVREDFNILTGAITHKFGLSLSIQTDLYDPSLFHNQGTQCYHCSILHDYCPEVIKLYQQLEERSDSSQMRNNSNHRSSRTKPSFDKKRWLQDWLNQRATERELFKAEQAQTDLKLALADKTADLHHLQTQWNEQQAKIGHLEETIEEQQAKIGYLEETITGMESSKFWKMRQFWMLAKQKLQFINI